VQYLLFYAEIIDKNHKNRAYADLGHITGSFGSVPVQVQFGKGTVGSVLGSSKMVEELN